MPSWFTEQEQQHIRFGLAYDELLHSSQSDFQKIEVYNTAAYGRLLTLDGCVMVTDADEFVYHEMISHVPAALHGSPEKVLVIGGGDGGTVTELTRYNGIKSLTLCEIDGQVVETARRFFPRIAAGLDDPRVEVRIGDGVAFMAGCKAEYDIILIDSTDPIGPGEGLFSGEFYQNVARALRPGGLMAAQTESPWLAVEIHQRIHRNIRKGFKNLAPFVGPVPTYPRGWWSWTVASQSDLNPAGANLALMKPFQDKLKFLTPGMLPGLFQLPPFYQQKIRPA